jgi:murein DD-endopeptidase MepM/ murein hydrolase activator NlpD
VVFFWVLIDPKRPVPFSLRHRVSVGSHTLEAGEVPGVETPAITIGPPLRGDGWVAINGPGRESGHRRALVATNGRARIAQRFGIDWVQRNESGSTYTGDPKDNKSYRCYGTDILAVADATVAATKDGIPENVPGLTSRAVPITSETVGGNYVILDLGGGKFAFYAHIQPGTLRVKTGNRVTRGQVLGLVGNSGNSTEPHLHFHVSDGPLPLGSEGLPYAITGMTGMPLQNARVSFPKLSP